MLPAIQVRGEWYRCVSLRRDPLSTEGALLLGGRLNPPGVSALYLAATPALAVAEHLQLGGYYGVRAFPPRLLVTVRVALSRVADLCDEHVLRLAGVTPVEMMSQWRSTPGDAAVQQLGTRLMLEGFQAARFPSAVDTSAANLVVFIEHLDDTCVLELVGQ